MTTPSRLGWFSSANITCVAKIWSPAVLSVDDEECFVLDGEDPFALAPLDLIRLC